MINYAISTFNVIVVIGKVEAKVEKFRRRSTGKGSGGGKHSLVLSSRVWSAWKEGARPEDCT